MGSSWQGEGLMKGMEMMLKSSAIIERLYLAGITSQFVVELEDNHHGSPFSEHSWL